MIELAGQPSYEVRLTLQGQRVTIQSTVPPGPDGWAMIRSICIEGVLAAHAQFLEQQRALVSPILVPPAEVRLVAER